MRQITLVALGVLAVVLATLPSSEAIVCRPGICDTVRCASVTRETCAERNQVYLEKGGFCNCCPVCLTVLDEGKPCNTIKGHPQTAICREGTACVKNICTRV